MAIYPERRAGVLTGHYRIEVQSKGRRLKGRAGSLSEAKATEKLLVVQIVAGGAVAPLQAAPVAHTTHTVSMRSAIDKAAAILESILMNHPFIDGNKRTAYVVMKLILFENNLDIRAGQNEKYDMMIAASKGEIRFEEIKLWISARLSQKNEP